MTCPAGATSPPASTEAAACNTSEPAVEHGANHTRACQPTLTDPEGEIFHIDSQVGPEENGACRWRVQPPGARSISVRVSLLNTPLREGLLSVYACPDAHCAAPRFLTDSAQLSPVHMISGLLPDSVLGVQAPSRNPIAMEPEGSGHFVVEYTPGAFEREELFFAFRVEWTASLCEPGEYAADLECHACPNPIPAHSSYVLGTGAGQPRCMQTAMHARKPHSCHCAGTHVLNRWFRACDVGAVACSSPARLA